jgi:hypothetical protein
MAEPLDEQYFTWLYSQVASVRLKNSPRSHWSLARHLYTKEFVWLIPNDDNRLEDGKDLRHEFLDACSFDILDPDWLDLGCSMLEMLIGLSRRLSFDADGEPSVWFWHLIETVDLKQYNDRNYNNKSQRDIDEILDRIIWRTYKPDGRGGLFPLRNPIHDQREVELWYQLSAYLIELF